LGIYIGQQSTTLSGGEAQRIKLLENYQKRYWKYFLYLDEPTTGLHFEDISINGCYQ
jgi:excinuclease ABC subunit A